MKIDILKHIDNEMISRKLKQLTKDQCLHIAKMILPNVNWEYVKVDESLDLHTLYEYSNKDLELYNHCLEIDFRIKKKVFSHRITCYQHSSLYHIDKEKLDKIYEFIVLS